MNQLILPISTIINILLQDGAVPDDFKQALVNPLLKNKILAKMDRL